MNNENNKYDLSERFLEFAANSIELMSKLNKSAAGRTNLLQNENLDQLQKEAHELIKINSKSISTAKKRQK